MSIFKIQQVLVDKDEHVNEVNARFGLAMYFTQVLEHGLVNAFIWVKLKEVGG